MEVITTNQPKSIVVEQLLAHILRLRITVQGPHGRKGIASAVLQITAQRPPGQSGIASAVSEGKANGFKLRRTETWQYTRASILHNSFADNMQIGDPQL